MPFSPTLDVLLRTVLSDTTAGLSLLRVLGDDAELNEISVIRSEPGCGAQPWHSDNGFQEAKTCTMFFALHDILDESMGPTRFCPNTHTPECFPDSRWATPTAASV